MLIIFDKDGTLIAPVDKGNGKTRPANTPEEQIVLPGVREKIDSLRANGHKIAIASNQGGVAWGYRDEDAVTALMEDCALKIGGADAVHYCPFDPQAAGKPGSHPFYAVESFFRKPNPGMLFGIMNALHFNAPDIIYVGDRESDSKAAQAAGIRFMWAKDFFGWEE